MAFKEYESPPEDGETWTQDDDDLWYAHMKNESSLIIHPELGTHIMCGNSSGAGACPLGSVCLAVSDKKPTHDYTHPNQTMFLAMFQAKIIVFFVCKAGMAYIYKSSNAYSDQWESCV